LTFECEPSRKPDSNVKFDPLATLCRFVRVVLSFSIPNGGNSDGSAGKNPPNPHVWIPDRHLWPDLLFVERHRFGSSENHKSRLEQALRNQDDDIPLVGGTLIHEVM
jgi:hypothetical protein